MHNRSQSRAIRSEQGFRSWKQPRIHTNQHESGLVFFARGALCTSRLAIVAILLAIALTPLPAQEVSVSGKGNGNGHSYGKGGKPKPSPSPTAGPVDAQRVWNNSGSDFNTTTNWTGGIVPTAGDVAAFTASGSNLTVNLSSLVSNSGLYFKGAGAVDYDITSSGGATFTLTATSTSTGSLAEDGDTTANAIRADNTSGTNTNAANLIHDP